MQATELIAKPDVTSEQSIVDISQMQGVTEIDSRFGKLKVNYNEKLFIEKGLLGIADKQYFCITPLPVAKFPQFRLLQSLEEHELSLIILPILLQNELIELQDLKEAMEDLNILSSNLELYLVVNIYREMNNIRISVNARAPIFVDKSSMQASQMVLRNPKYMVRHMLSGDYVKSAN
jgi:flagellar assembly factor FliW